MAKLLFLLIGVPLVETYLLMQIGGALGFWNTLWLVILTGVLGLVLARLEGLRVWRDWQHALAEGRMPADGVLSGLLLLVGGLLLIFPGVLTDAVGVLLLIPPTRRLAAAWLRQWLQRKIGEGAARPEPWVRVVRLDPDLRGGQPFVTEPYGSQPYAHQGGEAPAAGLIVQAPTHDPVASLRHRLRSERTESSKQPQVIDVDFEVTDIDRSD